MDVNKAGCPIFHPLVQESDSQLFMAHKDDQPDGIFPLRKLILSHLTVLWLGEYQLSIVNCVINTIYTIVRLIISETHFSLKLFSPRIRPGWV